MKSKYQVYRRNGNTAGQLMTKFFVGNFSRKFIVLLMIIYMTPFVYAVEGYDNDHDNRTDSVQAAQANIYCPVMPDMKVDSQIFTDYESKRVYFCCAVCKASFEKNPEKYLHRLSQFGAASNNKEHIHNHNMHRFSPGRFIKPLGITTLSLLIITGITGIFRRKLPGPLVRWHKRFGIITVISAVIHATLVLIAH